MKIQTAHHPWPFFIAFNTPSTQDRTTRNTVAKIKLISAAFDSLNSSCPSVILGSLLMNIRNITISPTRTNEMRAIKMPLFFLM